MNKFNIIEDKNTIAIVVVCYDRLESTKKLLDSIQQADYPQNNVPLIISIDCSGNQELYSYAQDFPWSKGPKYVIIHQERMGLKKHIYFCGDMSQYFKGVIILEDDLWVSKSFYNYSNAALNKYYGEERVAGIALYAETIYGYTGIPMCYYHDGSDGVMIQSTITSGECFSDLMWSRFRQWLAHNQDYDVQPLEMPEPMKRYKRAWSKYFNIYMLVENLYFLHPYVSTSTNCGEPGEHSKVLLNTIHSVVLFGKKDFVFNEFDDCIKYDMFYNYMGLGRFLGVPDDDLCVDFYGDKMNSKKRRYWLSPFQLSYQIVNSFGLVLEPIEANIIVNMQGNQLFLYDTTRPRNVRTITKYSDTYLQFFMRNFNPNLIIRLAKVYLKNKIVNRIKRYLPIK